MSIFTCKECGGQYDGDEESEAGDRDLCDMCHELRICPECGEDSLSNPSIPNTGGKASIDVCTLCNYRSG